MGWDTVREGTGTKTETTSRAYRLGSIRNSQKPAMRLHSTPAGFVIKI